MPGHFLGPDPLLTAVEIETEAVVVAAFREDGAAHHSVRLLLRHGRLPAIERIRAAIPCTGDVAIAVKGDQRFRARLDAETGHKREIPACRVPDDRNTLGIDAK